MLNAKKVAVAEVQQGKQVVSHGKDRGKNLLSQVCLPERVVVENNLLALQKMMHLIKRLKIKRMVRTFFRHRRILLV